MHTKLVFAGAVTCFLGVAFGAFGAHALSGVLHGSAAGWFETAVQYQFIHGIGLLFCALLWPQLGRGAMIAALLMIGGIALFCGSLYAMSLGAPRWLGVITPMGGGCLMLAWAVIAGCVVRRPAQNK